MKRLWRYLTEPRLVDVAVEQRRDAMTDRICGYCAGTGTIKPEWSSQRLVCAVCRGTGFWDKKQSS